MFQALCPLTVAEPKNAKNAVTNQIILLECDTQILCPNLFWRSGASSEKQKAFFFFLR